MTTTEFERARNNMIASQLEARGIHHERVIEAMRAVPRHCFVPPEVMPEAYEDHPLPIGSGQTISQPYMVALMTELADIQPADTVLEIGTGSGYQTAILAILGRKIISIERQELLADHARDRLHMLGYTNVTVISGDGTLGWPKNAPYDVIMVTAASPTLPAPLMTQLKPGGRLICPVGSRQLQHLVKVVRIGDEFIEERSIPCIFVPLIGEEGWADA